MPCQHCSSPNHTLSGCDANINPYWDLIKEYIAANPFKLRHQYQMINACPRNVLAIINTRLGYRCSTTKLLLAENIIKRYFMPRFGDIEFAPLGYDVTAAVADGYGRLMMWNVDHDDLLSHFRSEMYYLLNVYHLQMFGITFIQSLQNQTMLQVPAPAPVPQAAPVPAPVPARVRVQSNKSHLKKLKINVTVDNNLKVEDCFMCCDDKPIARLGCAHEYCVDCIVGSAKVRTKSVITCAVCRMEVTEVQVPNAATKKSFSAQIKKE